MTLIHMILLLVPVHVDMHLWHKHPRDMDLLPAGTGIGDEQVAESAPMVRALVVQRLERMWRSVEPYIKPPEPVMGLLDPGSRVDVRYIEAGVRITDRLIQLYGLLRPQLGQPEPDAEGRVDQRAVALARAEELEAKLRSMDALT